MIRPAPPLTTAIMELLPAIDAVSAAHQSDDDVDRCGYCTPASKRGYPHLWLAAAALDLVIHSQRLPPPPETAGDPHVPAGGVWSAG